LGTGGKSKGGGSGDFAGFTDEEKELLSSVDMGFRFSKRELISALLGGELDEEDDGFDVEVEDLEERYPGQKGVRVFVRSNRFADSKIAFMTRAFEFRADGDHSVTHLGLRVHPKYQGEGVTRQLFREQWLPIYSKMGIRRVELSTSQMGGYAWAKYGFNASGQTRTKMSNEMNLFSPVGGKKIMPKTPDHMAKLAVATIPGNAVGQLNFDMRGKPIAVRQMMRQVKDATKSKAFYDENGNFQLGKAYLFRAQWQGKLNLGKNSPDRKILNAYLKE
jgi:GNAT superfamily N-acetyltransferase